MDHPEPHSYCHPVRGKVAAGYQSPHVVTSNCIVARREFIQTKAEDITYKILMAHTAVDLSVGVNHDIKREWRPVGGLSVCNTGDDGVYYLQAMEYHEPAEEAEVTPSAS